jgi:hypothetical protein
VSRSPDHFATEIRAPTALFRAWTAHGMLRRMALTHLGTLVTNLRAEPAQRLGSLRGAADELRGEDTDVGAVAAEPDTTGHQIIIVLMVVMFHADHVVRASFAHLRA